MSNILALDPTKNVLFATAANTSVPSDGNELYGYDINTGNAYNLDSELGTAIENDIGIGTANAFLGGVAVDPTTDTLYVTASDYNQNGDDGADYIFKATYSVNTGGTISLSSPTLMYSGSDIGQPEGIAVDPLHNLLYVGDYSAGDFYEGSLSHTGGGGGLTQILEYDASNNSAVGFQPAVITVPTIAAGATTGVTMDNTPSVVVDPTAALTDQDDLGLASATIAISGGYQVGDVLTAATGGSFTTHFTNGTLTIANTSTSLAAWQTELESVAYATSSPVISTRTLTWSGASTAATRLRRR